ncbi:DUF5694 domain-containing protein [Heyndrickxia sp. MSNUG]|uniref:DUF5694 domain-containing protein n=1 Tax=Heyndrickxia sp. MSNUG TaxID=3136677 RepID=UPI003C2BA81A
MTEKEDMLSKTRQNEISEVITCLKKYEHTKVALEVLPEKEEALNENFFSYINGDYSLPLNEVHQIGFRLAKECNLKHVYAVDWNKSQEDFNDITDLGEWADTDEFKAFTKTGQELIFQSNTFLQNHSVREFLLWLNDTQNVLKGQEMYLKLALVGSKSNPAGAMWTAKYWYYRNMLIYKNLVSLIDSNKERIFVLYGAGHLHLLLQFLKESGLFDVKVASDFLG